MAADDEEKGSLPFPLDPPIKSADDKERGDRRMTKREGVGG